MSDDRPEWDRAREFIENFEIDPDKIKEPCTILVAEAMGPDGELHTVEINIKERMDRLMLILMPCPPTVH